jgi:hypothetical protein
MATKTLRPWSRAAWRLTHRQHGVVTRRQLLDLGIPAGTIRSRLRTGRLHPLWRGVYAVGRPDVDRLGRFMAATLVCGPDARLCGRSAADLYGIRRQEGGSIEVAIEEGGFREQLGIKLRRRVHLGPLRSIEGIPLVDPVSVLIDLAAELTVEEVEDAVNNADRLDLVPAHRLPHSSTPIPLAPASVA